MATKVDVINLHKEFGDLKVLRGINFQVEDGEVVCLIGPSGSGKSTILRCLNKLEESTDGTIIVDGHEITSKSTDINKVRQKIGMVFQDFRLLEKKTVYENVAFAMEVLHKSKREIRERVPYVLDLVGIADKAKKYPDELSAGEQQRVGIARALVNKPRVLICDEPTTALDVTIQAQILELINKLKREHNLSIIFITHDLGVVANMADRIAVMYAGKIVEYGTAEEVFYDPRHPYTWALLSSMPDLDTNEKLDAIPGTPPNMIYPPVGDAFAERNKYAMEIDFEMQPPMYEVSPTHYAATWLLHPNAPKVEIPKIITERIKRMKERGGNHGE